MLNDARNDKQVLIGHRLFIVDDKKRNQLDKKMFCSVAEGIHPSSTHYDTIRLVTTGQ